MKPLLALALGLGLTLGAFTTEAAPPPVRDNQPRPDIFPCVGCQIVDRDGDGDGDLQDLNPTTRKAKATRSITYRVERLAGCQLGSMVSDLEYMNAVEAPKVGLTLARNDVTFDFKVYISCGMTQVQKCGGVNVFCLPDNFPYNTDVYMSDVLSNYDAGSRIGIPIHEIIMHAIATWNEQYATCGASCGFAPSPNWRDVMNTGPESRHGIEAIEKERWERTMYALTVQVPTVCTVFPCFDGTRWQFNNDHDGTVGVKVAYNPSTDYWERQDAAGTWVGEWSACTSYGARWNAIATDWVWPITGQSQVWLGLYQGMPALWSRMPGC